MPSGNNRLQYPLEFATGTPKTLAEFRRRFPKTLKKGNPKKKIRGELYYVEMEGAPALVVRAKGKCKARGLAWRKWLKDMHGVRRPRILGRKRGSITPRVTLYKGAKT